MDYKKNGDSMLIQVKTREVNLKIEYILLHESNYFYSSFAHIEDKKTNCRKIKTEVKDPFL